PARSIHIPRCPSTFAAAAGTRVRRPSRVERVLLDGPQPGRFRIWWRRWHDDSDEDLDNAHLMRMAGRFSRRLRGWAAAHDVAGLDCKSGERKHLIAEEYLAAHPRDRPGVFLILVARASATTWDVQRSTTGAI